MHLNFSFCKKFLKAKLYQKLNNLMLTILKTNLHLISRMLIIYILLLEIIKYCEMLAISLLGILKNRDTRK